VNVCVVDVPAASSSKLTTVKKDTKDIWTEDEVTAGAEFDDVDDPRQQPQYVLSMLLSSSSASLSSYYLKACLFPVTYS